MQKKIIVGIFIINLAFITSCSQSTKSIIEERIEMLNQNSDEKIADNCLEQIIECINRKDAESLKALFSNRAIENSENFNNSLMQLFKFVQDDIISHSKSDGMTVTESNDYGKKTKEISSYYYINTNNKTYFLLLRDYPIDEKDVNNKGLYTLLIVKKENEEDIWDGSKGIIYDGDKKLDHPGIYIPIE